MWKKARSWKPVCSSKTYKPFTSVIVPTYNEENTIIRKLKNIVDQDYSRDQFEIIVIDSASEDRTVELVENFGKSNAFINFKFVKENKRKGKATALNNVKKHCTGEILVITDADAYWKKDTLSKIILNFNDSNVGAVTGKQILVNPIQSSNTKDELAYRAIFSILRTGESCLDSTPIFNGPLMAFRSNLFETLSEDTIADDSQLAVKIRKKGFKSLYDPNAIFYECATFNLRSTLDQKVRRGQGLIQLFLRERSILFNSKYGKFGSIIFPAEFFMHVFSPVMFYSFLILFMYTLIIVNPYLLIGALIAFGVSTIVLNPLHVNVAKIFSSFLSSQFFLLLSLASYVMGKQQHKWKKINEVRTVSQEDNINYLSQPNKM